MDSALKILYNSSRNEDMESINNKGGEGDVF